MIDVQDFTKEQLVIHNNVVAYRATIKDFRKKIDRAVLAIKAEQLNCDHPEDMWEKSNVMGRWPETVCGVCGKVVG